MDISPADPPASRNSAYIKWGALALITVGAILMLPYAQAALQIGAHSSSLSGPGPRPQLSGSALAAIPDHRMVIPAIDLSAPWSDDIEDLDDTIVRYGFSTPPGRPGRAVLTAHNLPQNGNYLFSSLFMIKRGDLIGIGQGTGRFAYKVESMKVISPDELERIVTVDYLRKSRKAGAMDVSQTPDATAAESNSSQVSTQIPSKPSFGSAPLDEQRLTLVTCYPPTVDYMRLVVEAKRVELD